jgi:5-(carboxyamino)imidazole ribonucleotide synthase
MDQPISPGATIGILGGGQLGRMIALAAAQLGLKAHIYCPDPDSPAFDVAAAHTIAAYEDEAALTAFAQAADVVTYEFENVPAATAALLARHRPLRPGAKALETAQDRLTEKAFVTGLGIKTAPFRAVDDLAGLERAVAELGRPSVLKTRRFGYDGKGQVMIRPETDLAEAWNAIGGQPAILEGFVPFTREVSVIAARSPDGEFAAYDVCENEHRHHILDVTRVPANIDAKAAAQALDVAHLIADALDYVGVLTVELFLVEAEGGQRVLVNEIAPRVHNSGHWTIEGAQTSQFEQHVRAICGWPLGAAQAIGAIEMRNLIGDDVAGWRDILATPGVHLHLYGKAEARPGRKMGHVTLVNAAPAKSDQKS